MAVPNSTAELSWCRGTALLLGSGHLGRSSDGGGPFGARVVSAPRLSSSATGSCGQPPPRLPPRHRNLRLSCSALRDSAPVRRRSHVRCCRDRPLPHSGQLITRLHQSRGPDTGTVSGTDLRGLDSATYTRDRLAVRWWRGHASKSAPARGCRPTSGRVRRRRCSAQSCPRGTRRNRDRVPG